MKCEAAEDCNRSEFVERFPELSLFFKAFSQLDSEMICIFPYFCPCGVVLYALLVAYVYKYVLEYSCVRAVAYGD